MIWKILLQFNRLELRFRFESLLVRIQSVLILSDFHAFGVSGPSKIECFWTIGCYIFYERYDLELSDFGLWWHEF